MYTANLNSLAPETLKKCSCLLSYHFLLVRYAKMCILMAAIFKHRIGPPLVSAIVIQISELGSLVSKTPEKWSCLLFYDHLLARNVKMFFDGGHFESSNTATRLKIGFGSRQIRVQQIKMYLCNKFDAFVQICTFIPLTALTTRKVLRFEITKKLIAGGRF